jgi:L-alanine-DL-glutamate epimerase-like enolase superfamily enzyme
MVSLEQHGVVGRGECVPYDRYGESINSVREQILDVSDSVCNNATREELLSLLPAGAARNAIDCAIWDLEVKSGKESLPFVRRDLKEITTAFTIPYSDVDTMSENAKVNSDRPVLKIKLGSERDLERLFAVSEAAPKAQLIVDANEGWKLEDFARIAPALVVCGVTIVEQPLRAGDDGLLNPKEYPFLLCADESCHTRESLSKIVGHYDMINIKLDKTGGLTEALALKSAARDLDLKVMVGCMVGSSLSMAPAFMLAQSVDMVDLDAPLLLRNDIQGGLNYSGSRMSIPERTLWG